MNKQLINSPEDLISTNIELRANSQELVTRSKQLIAISKILKQTNEEIRMEIANLIQEKKHHDDTATRCRRGSLSLT